ncbi:MAG: hypothetical protein mread185_000572 [Mycoplasmataceae bacterium]|nr:MAG: hypothetical protein mread185_000572 [Mycoplasmataceae bacterium]
MKCWVVYRKLDTKLTIYVNLPFSEEKDFDYHYKQDLTKKRHYFILNREKEKIFEVLTITSKEKARWGKFGPIKCPCLDKDSYISLNTRILISHTFAKQHNINLLDDKKDAHCCLDKELFTNLLLALKIYWKKPKQKLFLLEFGIDENNRSKH